MTLSGLSLIGLAILGGHPLAIHFYGVESIEFPFFLDLVAALVGMSSSAYVFSLMDYLFVNRMLRQSCVALGIQDHPQLFFAHINSSSIWTDVLEFRRIGYQNTWSSKAVLTLVQFAFLIILLAPMVLSSLFILPYSTVLFSQLGWMADIFAWVGLFGIFIFGVSCFLAIAVSVLKFRFAVDPDVLEILNNPDDHIEDATS